MTLNMVDLNGNEKYVDLPLSLPTNASHLESIQNGDLMLYGSSTLVLFYKTFSTSYSYTKFGRVDDVSGLGAARDVLNASDVNKIVSLYTTDGMLLPNAAPTAVGTGQVKEYQYVFDNFDYTLEFIIGEVVVSYSVLESKLMKENVTHNQSKTCAT